MNRFSRVPVYKIAGRERLARRGLHLQQFQNGAIVANHLQATFLVGKQRDNVRGFSLDMSSCRGPPCFIRSSTRPLFAPSATTISCDKHPATLSCSSLPMAPLHRATFTIRDFVSTPTVPCPCLLCLWAWEGPIFVPCSNCAVRRRRESAATRPLSNFDDTSTTPPHSAQRPCGMSRRSCASTCVGREFERAT
jgi:hypothetical protein